jgi:hypothetical protein
MFGNVTMEPTDFAVAVEDPAIKEVMILRTGATMSASRLISRLRYDRLVRLRTDIRDKLHSDAPLVGCGYCGRPVYLVESVRKAFFFRHLEEDGTCPAISRGDLNQDQIRALKYAGRQESAAHRDLKALIARSLLADSTFSDVMLETTWRGVRDPDALRRPDVQAIHGGKRIAFEAQLSTTFLDVVVDRKRFYREEGGLLVWVLRNFEPDYRRATTDDILFNNNSNVLVIDKETTAASEAAGRFMVRCHYRRPTLVAGAVGTAWEARLVPWSDLTLDFARQRAFHFDCEVADVRTELVRLVCAPLPADDEERRERGTTWQRIEADLTERGILLPQRALSDQRFTTIIRCIESALAGRPVRYSFSRLVGVAHLLAEKYPEALITFTLALRHAGHEKTIEAEDKSGKWSRKLEKLRSEYRLDRSRFTLDTEMDSIIHFLYPHIFPRHDK